MWKLAVLLFAACFTTIKPQDVTLTCDFRLSAFDEYSCVLDGITVLDLSLNVVFDGVHVDNRTNEDVQIVLITNSTTPFIIQQIFTTFPNLLDLTITRSGLETVSIPESAQLVWIDLFDNNITRLEANSFRNQTDLIYCFLHYNRITELDENAFAGLDNLLYLEFAENLITEMRPQTFSTLPAVVYINFMDNFVTRIDAELFSRNPNLQTINMSFNGINEISPQFGDNLRQSARIIGLVGNVCVDQTFEVATDEGWNGMLSDLQTCFNNFNNGTDTDTRRIMMEFTGPLTIYDENGNVLARV